MALPQISAGMTSMQAVFRGQVCCLGTQVMVQVRGFTGMDWVGPPPTNSGLLGIIQGLLYTRYLPLVYVVTISGEGPTKEYTLSPNPQTLIIDEDSYRL